jgi:hypothetical protein
MSSSAEDSGRDSGTLRAHNFLQPGYRRSQYISDRLLEPGMTHIIQRGFSLIDDYQLRATATDNYSRMLIRISEV